MALARWRGNYHWMNQQSQPSEAASARMIHFALGQILRRKGSGDARGSFGSLGNGDVGIYDSS